MCPGPAMGSKLARWAVKQPDLSRLRKTKDVLVAMCLAADDKHGQFWGHPDWFLAEYLPDIRTRSSLRDHQKILADLGLIGRIRKGNRHTHTKYQVLAYGEMSADVFSEYEKAAAERGDKHQSREHIGSTPDILTPPDVGSVPDILTPPDVGSIPDILTPQMSALHPTSHDKPNYKKPDAATNLSADAAASSDFFEDIAKACSGIGVHGVRGNSFSQLHRDLSEFPRQLGPDDSRWIADEFKLAVQSGRIQNPPGFLVHLVRDYLKSGGRRFYIEDTPDTWGTHDRPGDKAINF